MVVQQEIYKVNCPKCGDLIEIASPVMNVIIKKCKVKERQYGGSGREITNLSCNKCNAELFVEWEYDDIDTHNYQDSSGNFEVNCTKCGKIIEVVCPKINADVDSVRAKFQESSHKGDDETYVGCQCGNTTTILWTYSK